MLNKQKNIQANYILPHKYMATQNSIRKQTFPNRLVSRIDRYWMSLSTSYSMLIETEKILTRSNKIQTEIG